MLVSVLGKLRLEEPTTYVRYRPKPDKPESIEYARSLSFIHLLLKACFGIADFLTRHQQITEGQYDGGLDAFHLIAIQSEVTATKSEFKVTL